MTVAGTISPNGLDTKYQLAYGTSSKYGSLAPASAVDVGSGAGATNVSVDVTGLTSNTTYHYAISATNSSGTTTSNDQTFKTLALPVATTGKASSLTASTVTLAGEVNPKGADTTYKFAYGATNGYGSVAPATAVDAGNGTSAKAVSVGVTNLTAGTTYHYQLQATSAAGSGDGSDGVFETPSLPAVSTSGATNLTATTATVPITVNPEGLATKYQVNYGTTNLPSYASQAPTKTASAGSGTSDKTVSVKLTGLTADTTYHYDAAATSNAGATNIADATFTTPQLPVVTATGATNIGTTNVQIAATIDSEGLDTKVLVAYGLTDKYGAKAPVGATDVGTGATNVVSIPVGSLRPDATYHYQVVATSSAGATNVGDATFTTLPLPPVATTGLATDVTGTTVTLKGTVNPEGTDTTYQVAYGATNGYGSVAIPTGTGATNDAGSGRSAKVVSIGVTNLTPNTTYHYQVRAVSAAGTDAGKDMTFKTTTLPTAATTGATNLTATTATVPITVNPDGLATKYQVNYGTTNLPSYASQAPTKAASAGTGTSDKSASVKVSGLTPGTTYHYDVVATSSAGVTTVADATFTTPTVPAVSGVGATNITTTAAAIEATIDAGGADTSVQVAYGLSAKYGVHTGATDVGTGATNVVLIPVTGLKPGATYHYQLTATSPAGAKATTDATFVTLLAPTATTGAASSIGTTNVTIAGTVNPEGTDTKYQVAYGTSTSYGSLAPATAIDAGDGTSAVTISVGATNLTPGTLYHYQITATSAAGTVTGHDATFTTLRAPTVVITGVSGVTASQATISGTINPNGQTTTYLVYFGTTDSYGSDTSSFTANGTTAQPFIISVAVTEPSTTYHYEVSATSSAGTTTTTDSTFTTLASAGASSKPSVTKKT